MPGVVATIGEGDVPGEGNTGPAVLDEPMFDGVVERAHAALGPELRLVMIVRDPVERLISHLKHHLVMGLVRSEECDRAVLEDPRYVAFSDYGMQLRPWIETFGRERLLCLSLDAFMADRLGEVRRVGRFLGVDRPQELVIDGEIRNEGTQLRSNARSIWRKATRSKLYKRHLRAMIPDRLRDGVRDVLLPVRPVPPLHLAPSTMAEIEGRLAHVADDLHQLVGLDMRVHRRRSATVEVLETC